MEDCFGVRVDRTFGSLVVGDSSPVPNRANSSTSSSSSSAAAAATATLPLWCLTDEEIERREWNRSQQPKTTGLPSPDRRQYPKPPKPKSSYHTIVDEILTSSFTNNVSISDLDDESGSGNEEEDVDDGDDDDDAKTTTTMKTKQPLPPGFIPLSSSRQGLQAKEEGEELKKPDEQWDIQSSVGLDPTLDLEEEEDVYDRVAVGVDDEKYMRYTLDSSTEVEHDDKLNQKAYMEFLSLLNEHDDKLNEKAYMEFLGSLKGSSAMETGDHAVSSDPPGSVVFIPKKTYYMKSENDSCVDKKGAAPLGIAAADPLDGEAHAMEEDELEMANNKSNSLQRTSRQYRKKNAVNSDELV